MPFYNQILNHGFHPSVIIQGRREANVAQRNVTGAGSVGFLERLTKREIASQSGSMKCFIDENF